MDCCFMLKLQAYCLDRGVMIYFKTGLDKREMCVSAPSRLLQFPLNSSLLDFFVCILCKST